MYFTEQDESLSVLLTRVKQKYGKDVQIIEQRSIAKKGIGGMLGNKLYVMKGFCPEPKSAAPITLTSPDTSALSHALKDAHKIAHQRKESAPRHFQQLHQKLDILIKRGAASKEDTYPEIGKIERLLIENDFDYAFIAEILVRARRFFTIEQMQNSKKCHVEIIKWIAERIHVSQWKEIHNTRITTLIGPTGVGKTTTLAKIAKLLAFGSGTKEIASIGLFTIDNYRLAAKEQLDGYGRLMGATVKLIRNTDELHSALALHEQDAHILIDTIGRSPYESASLGSMHEMLQQCGKEITCSLVISATTKKADLELIKKFYHSFDFRSVIVTKLDETTSVGNVISAFAGSDIPFVHYTNGQKVPLDIQNASKTDLLRKIFGFDINKSDYPCDK